ncbi:MAG: nucleoside hydrolase, partial [Spirochaetales bacterium]|nr:nucleoside hydrolase [Spirochaetales bacterium]
QESPAAADLVKKAGDTKNGPLYVIAIGAITNVASAMILEPAIIENIVVVWLGGHAYYWPDAGDFNLKQDVKAAQLVFDSGAAVVHIPGRPVTSHLLATVPEIERYVAGRGAIGDYLAGIFREYTTDPFGWSKPIWDISATSWIIEPSWVPTVLEPSPIITERRTYSRDPSRHLVRVAVAVNRDAIFRDVFTKLGAFKG